MATATFRPMAEGETEYKISDIVVKGSDIGAGNESWQKVEQSGVWGNTYYYLTVEGAGVEKSGWYRDVFGEIPVTDEDRISVGQAFYCYSSQPITMTYAGKIDNKETSVSLNTGYSMFGNPIPKTVKISDIEIIGEGIGYGDDKGQATNPDGTWGDEYYYLTEEGAGVTKTGWYKDVFGETPVTDEDVLEPGKCWFFYSSKDIVMKFPSTF